MTVGEKIKTFRREKGLTQKQLAEKSGMIEETIRKYELGKLNPKKETLLRIAQALDVQIGELDICYYQPDIPSVGENIKKIRKERGLTQEELASLSGLSTRGLQDFEYGVTHPKLETLLRIAAVLKVKPYELDHTTGGLWSDESFEIIKTRLQVVKTKLMSGLVIQAYQELNEVLEVMK